MIHFSSAGAQTGNPGPPVPPGGGGAPQPAHGSGGNGGGPTGPPGPPGPPSGPPPGTTVPRPPVPSKAWTGKPDAGAFKTLREEAAYQRWREGVSTLLAAQGLDEVEDVQFLPRNELEASNHIAKSKFVYSVLYSTVKTLKGQSIILAHLQAKDGVRALEQLDIYHATSAAALLRRGDLNAKLVTVRLDGTWKRSQMDFLTSYMTMLRRFNDYATHPHDHISEHNAKMYLRTAVYGAANLREVSAREVQDMATRQCPPMSFSQYVTCLETAASLHDTRTGKVSMLTSANNTELFPADHYPHDDTSDMPPDSDGDALLINAADTSRPRLPETLFRQLSQPGKRAWTQIPDADKNHIVDALPRSVNVHDMASTSDFSRVTDHDSSPSNATTSTAATSTSGTSVNAAQSSNSAKPVARDGNHPADPRRLLSQPTTKSTSKSTGDGTPTRSSHNVTFAPPALTSYEVRTAMQSYWEQEPDEQFHDCAEDFWKAD